MNVLDNSGTVSFNHPYFHLNGTFNNLSSGIFNAFGSGSQGAISSSGLFDNAGTFNKKGNDTFNCPSPFFNNTGTLNIEGGTFVIRSLSQNANSGRIVLLGGHISSVNTVQVHAGTIEGNGTIAADVRSHATIMPGQSAGKLTFDGNLSLFTDSQLVIELGGLTAGLEFDQVVVTGTFGRNGTLNVHLLEEFSPSPGDSFHIVDSTNATGVFNIVDLPALDEGLTWDTSDLYTAGILSVGLTGDFNLDGMVDAADYVVWRKNGGTPEEFSAWRANFGRSAASGSGSASNASVPEPASLLLLLVTAIAAKLLLGRIAR
jgi:hypothetical protein